MSHTPYKKGTPLWSMHLIQSNNKSSVIMKIHHCYADGYSQNGIIDKLLNVKSVDLTKKEENKKINKLNVLVTGPWKLAELYLDALTSPKNVYNAKKTSCNGFIAMVTLPLDEYKSIRRKTRTNFAVVGLSWVI